MRHGGRAGRDVRQPTAGTPTARTTWRARPGRPHPASDGAPQSQQHAGGRAGSVLRGAEGAGEPAAGRGPARRRALTPSLPSPQACFASLVSQDYVNGTDQEEIRTGERCRTAGPGLGAAGRCVARPGVLPSSAFWLRGWEGAGTGIPA